MSERVTSIGLPGLRGGAGIAEWGLKTPEEMVEALRKWAALRKLEAEKILAANASDFRVTTYLGPHAQRKLEVLQEGKKP